MASFTLPTKPNLTKPTYQTKHIIPNQTIPTEPNLSNQTYNRDSTKPNYNSFNKSLLIIYHHQPQRN